MNTLQVPFHFFPDAVGGTEVYVAALSKCLQAAGTGVTVAAPGTRDATYEHEGIAVRRFASAETPADLRSLYGQGDVLATSGFLRILDEVRPDLVHLHAMSPAISAPLVRAVKERGVPVIFTCHIPGILCPRGTLLRYGSAVCDGTWELSKCTACTLQDKGLPIPIARLVARLPLSVAAGLGQLGIKGSAATALRMRGLQTGRRHALEEFLSLADRIVAVCQWLRDVLVANGADPRRVVVSRHGVTQDRGHDRRFARRRADQTLRVAFLGRLNPTKGAHVIVEALRRRAALPVALDVFGIVQDDDRYVATLKREIAGDSRIRLLDPLRNEDVVDRLSEYDVLAVPSQWMETGPLVVYDAFAAGIPVVGSRRGGLTELVTDGHDGILVDPPNPEAWAAAFESLQTNPDLLDRLRNHVHAPRSMSDVAAEMRALYEAVALPLECAAYGT